MTNIYLQLNKNIYSRKIHIILIILTFILFNTKISHAEVYKFTDKSETYLKEITLENGDVIKSIKDEKKDSYKLFQYKKQDSLAYSLEVENALVFIRGAYPSQNKAKIAIVESGGGGNCCPQHLVSILYVDNASVLKIFDIGTNYSNELSILINYTNGKLNIEVDNFSDGETDKYGDLNKNSLKFVEDKGFIRKSFKPGLLKIVNSHPDAFFSDANLREKLAISIGHENFKTLRYFMGVAVPSKIADGRYIVMRGMKPHSGGESNGVLIVDSFTDNYWAIWVNDHTNVKFGSTSKWNNEVINLAIKTYESDDYFLEYKKAKFEIKKYQKSSLNKIK